MKTRNGFVSNSSSSSFIIFYDEVSSASEIGKLLARDAKVWVLGDQCGHSGECADDCFTLTKELWEAIKKHHLVDHFYFYNVFHEIDAEDDVLLNKDSLPQKCSVKKINKDYRACATPKDIEERYVS